MSFKIPKYSKIILGLYFMAGIFYTMLLAVFFTTGSIETTYIAGIPAFLLFTAIVCKRTSHLVSYKSYNDYIEFANADLLKTDKLEIKSFSQRLVKHHIQEIHIKGFAFWKRIDVYLKSDSGRTYSSRIPLRFLNGSQVIALLEDLSNSKIEEVWEADYGTAQNTATLSNAAV